MVGDAHVLHSTLNNSSNNNSNCNKKAKDKKNKKKKRGGGKKKMTIEQSIAFKSVSEWVFSDQYHNSNTSCSSASCVIDDFVVQKPLGRAADKVVFELHCHSKFSDGYLSPSKLVERAHGNGVGQIGFLCFLSYFWIRLCSAFLCCFTF